MIDVIKDENITKHSELFEKSIKKGYNTKEAR